MDEPRYPHDARGFSALQVADHMPTHPGIADCRRFLSEVLDTVLAQIEKPVRKSGSNRIQRVGLGHRHERDLARIPATPFGGTGDPLPNRSERAFYPCLVHRRDHSIASLGETVLVRGYGTGKKGPRRRGRRGRNSETLEPGF